jgi:hypothetical protein
MSMTMISIPYTMPWSSFKITQNLFQGCPMGGSWGRHELAHNANRICNVRIMAHALVHADIV